MNDANTSPSSNIARFRDLHESGCFVLPNPWDAGSAVYLEHLGFKALCHDVCRVRFFSRVAGQRLRSFARLMLAHISEIVEATSLQ